MSVAGKTYPLRTDIQTVSGLGTNNTEHRFTYDDIQYPSGYGDIIGCTTGPLIQRPNGDTYQFIYLRNDTDYNMNAFRAVTAQSGSYMYSTGIGASSATWIWTEKELTFVNNPDYFDSTNTSFTSASVFEEWLAVQTIEEVSYLTTNFELSSIANAIRSKTGTSASLTYPAGFISAINSITTGTDVSDTTASASDVL